MGTLSNTIGVLLTATCEQSDLICIFSETKRSCPGYETTESILGGDNETRETH